MTVKRVISFARTRILAKVASLAFFLAATFTSAVGQDPSHALPGPGPDEKVSPVLRQQIQRLIPGQKIRVEVVSTDGILPNAISTRTYGHTPGTDGKRLYYSVSEIGPEEIYEWIEKDNILYLEWAREARVELKQEGLDLTLNEVTSVHSAFPDLNGAGIPVSIKENAFDTADIDFKGRYFITANSPALLHIHATNMASILGGGANSDPSALGVAWDAMLTSSDFSVLLPDEDAYFIENEIRVQNHSYGTGIENYYGIESMAYDDQVYRLDQVIHVFSSGNEGDQTPGAGLYSGLDGWANLTGQFKQSKNTLTVGATDSLDVLWPLSSKGPAYDGRIKPEVVAYGHGGTSGAAAIVSGVCVLMQQAYRALHAGQDPPASLLKAILTNTAKDIGRPGPDHESGFGSVRALDALRAMETGQYILSEVDANDSVSFFLDIPEGAGSLKITMAWTDPPAMVHDPKSLVHNLDMEVRSMLTGETWYPWILSVYPQQDSLLMPARRGKDTLNPLEQVTISAPVAGTYEVRIKGHALQSATQAFALTWIWDRRDDFQWIYPMAMDILKPGQPNILRWKTSPGSQDMLAYRKVQETGWHSIASGDDLMNGYAKWLAPGEEGWIQLQWSNADTSIASDTILLAAPVRPDVGFLCPDSLLIYWDPKLTADAYQIWRLGERHLEELDVTQDSFYILNDAEVHGFHYAVAPVYGVHRGPLSYGFDARTQGAGCYIDAFFLRHIGDGIAVFEVRLGTLYHVIGMRLEKRFGNTYLPVTTVHSPVEWIQLMETDQLTKGVNFFRLVVELEGGAEIMSEEIDVYFLDRHDIWVYPNPASGRAPLQIHGHPGEMYSIDILDIQGREWYHRDEPDNPEIVSLDGLAPGPYIVVFRYEGGEVEAKKVLVVR